MIRPTIRTAREDEGAIIERILTNNGNCPGGVNWAVVGKEWLVAERNGEVIGCVQALPGKPLGHIGFIGIVPKYQNRGYGVLLWRMAETLLKAQGCDTYTGMTGNPHIERAVLKTNGFVDPGPVKWLAKRLGGQ